MALTLQQQQDIVYYLGWPGKTIIQGSTHYNSVIASRLINLNDVIEAQAIALVTRIVNIDTILVKYTSRALVLEIQDIKLNPAEAARLRTERRKIIGELSDLLDIDVNKSGGGGSVNVIA